MSADACVDTVGLVLCIFLSGPGSSRRPDASGPAGAVSVTCAHYTRITREKDGSANSLPRRRDFYVSRERTMIVLQHSWESPVSGRSSYRVSALPCPSRPFHNTHAVVWADCEGAKVGG